VADKVLLSAGRYNFDACHQLACEYNLGLELMVFAYPDVLDGDWHGVLDSYERKLATFEGVISMHAPFMDLVSGSPDERINQVGRERYMQAIHIAAELGAKHLVAHANFIGLLHQPAYREGWHRRNVTFWSAISDYAKEFDVTICLENMWEFSPTIIPDLLAEVNHPNLRACLDIGHSHLYSAPEYTLQNWISAAAPWLVHTHMNNNNGRIDIHQALDAPDGVLNYHEVLKQIHAMAHPPHIVLEMDNVEDMRRSLSFFRLNGTH